MSELTVQYERKFSDRNYGSEGLAMSWTWESDSEGPGEELQVAAEMLKQLVLQQLARSASEGVRWAANHELHAHDPKPAADGEAVTAGDDLEDLPF